MQDIAAGESQLSANGLEIGCGTAVTIGLIIFDCDGVLVDSEPLAMRTMLETIAEAGAVIDAGEAHEAFLGKSLASICELLRQNYRIDFDTAALERMRDGRQGSHDALVVRDRPGLLVERHVEVHAHDHAFALEIDVTDRRFVQLAFHQAGV